MTPWNSNKQGNSHLHTAAAIDGAAPATVVVILLAIPESTTIALLRLLFFFLGQRFVVFHRRLKLPADAIIFDAPPRTTIRRPPPDRKRSWSLRRVDLHPLRLPCSINRLVDAGDDANVEVTVKICRRHCIPGTPCASTDRPPSSSSQESRRLLHRNVPVQLFQFEPCFSSAAAELLVLYPLPFVSLLSKRLPSPIRIPNNFHSFYH
ncbi:unnamed protein product [Linum trigynum]|uniref:Uncharacterized protein n=1 Tax=Linum trigynum TaxID=586398 RepID=A0AAV2DB51_9ROSI